MKKIWLVILTLLVLFLSEVSSAQSLVDYLPVDDFENVKVIKLSSDTNSSNFLIFIKHQVPAHQHRTHSESIYVISGEAEFRLGNDWFHIKAGDFIHVPENEVHAVKVTSEIPLKVLSNQAPEFHGKDRVYLK